MNTNTDTNTDTPSGPPATPPDGQAPSGLHRFWLIVFLLGTAVAGAGFVYKLREFFWGLSGTPGFEFAGIHLVTYGLVAGGFLALLLVTFLRGNLANIEAPKYELLESERRYDHAEFD
jgi:hypothetical protein